MLVIDEHPSYFDNIDDDVKDKVIFKSRLEGAGNLYCTEKFKVICEQNQLNGLVFSSNLTESFN